MAYLEQFARNRRSKGDTRVLTARLPEDLYDEFQNYCDSLGLSISEAIYLLVEKEMDSIPEKETRSFPEVAENKDDEVKTNTSEFTNNKISGEINTNSRNNATKKKRNSNKKNINRFSVKPFVVENELPCPLCGSWFNRSNFSRHAKTNHNSNTEAIYTEHKDKVNEMVKNKIAETKGELNEK